MTTTQGIRENIKQIIDARKPLRDIIRARREALREISLRIGLLEDQRQRMEKDGSPSMRNSLSNLNFKALKAKIDDEYERLEKVERRFQRETLNIGVLGYAGQGKSTFLSNVSGLGEDVIPSGSRGDCTGARSMIMHSDNLQPAGATITFYTEEEFLNEVLASYYKELNLQIMRPYDLGSFARTTFPQKLDDIASYDGNHAADEHTVPSMFKKGKQTLQGIYDQLVSYHTYLGEYRTLIGHDPVSIPLPDIEKVRLYIAQEDNSGNPLYKYLAVKEAVIRKNFGSLDVQEVGLLDTPGLGGLRIADQERLVRALEEDIDVMLFFYKPSPDRSNFSGIDTALYDFVRGTAEGVSLAESSFAVINPRGSKAPDTDNQVNCNRLQKQINDMHIMQKSYIVDCKHGDTKKEVLTPILEHLKIHVTQYRGIQVSQSDKTYMDFWDKRYDEIKTEVAHVRARLAHFSASSTFDHDEEILFKSLFGDNLWIDLAAALEEVLASQRDQSQAINDRFIQYFEEKLALCRSDPGLETIEQIKRRGEAEGENRYIKIYSDVLDHMRTHLTNRFVDIDDRLVLHMKEVKKAVAEVFLKQGRLEYLYPGIPSEQLFEKMAAEPHLSAELHEALNTFNDFQLSFWEYLQILIQGGMLNNLMPDAAIMRYLVSNYVSPRLTRLYQKFKLDSQSWMQLMNIVIVFVSNATAPNPVIALMNDINAMLQLDDVTKNALKDAVKSLFVAETQPHFTAFEPKEIHKALQAAHQDAVNMIEQKLQTFYSLPGEATVAAVQGFVDQVLHAKDAEKHWDTFYRSKKPFIWSKEFGQTFRWKTYQQQWHNHINGFKQAADNL